MLGCKGLKLGRKLPINHYVSPGEGRGGSKDFLGGGMGAGWIIWFWGGNEGGGSVVAK